MMIMTARRAAAAGRRFAPVSRREGGSHRWHRPAAGSRQRALGARRSHHGRLV